MNGIIKERAYNKIKWISIFSCSEETGVHLLSDTPSNHLNRKCEISRGQEVAFLENNSALFFIYFD